MVSVISAGLVFAAGAQSNLPAGPLERMAMIGASVTAGYISSPIPGNTNTQLCRLDHYLDAAVNAPHDPVRNFSGVLFFLQAEDSGRSQIDATLQMKPTLIVGLDFLFWYCYGDHLTEPQRLEKFNRGLQVLEPIPCPLVLGDIPDASAAIGGMLSPGEMPARATLAEANRRLRAWAGKHPRVSVVKLANFMQTIRTNGDIVVHGFPISKGGTPRLLQPDHLHLLPSGCAALALAALDALPATDTARKVRWDPKEVERLATNSPPVATGQNH